MSGEQLPPTPAALELLIYGAVRPGCQPEAFGDPSHRLPVEVRHALVHQPDGEVQPLCRRSLRIGAVSTFMIAGPERPEEDSSSDSVQA